MCCVLDEKCKFKRQKLLIYAFTCESVGLEHFSEPHRCFKGKSSSRSFAVWFLTDCAIYLVGAIWQRRFFCGKNFNGRLIALTSSENYSEAACKIHNLVSFI